MKVFLGISIFLLAIISLSVQQQCSFEANIDYFGNDIFNNSLYAPTMDRCCTLCQGVDRCQAWTYVPSTQACWLKTNIGSRRLNSAGRCSGVRVQTGILTTSATRTTVTPAPTVAPGVTRTYGCLVQPDRNFAGADLAQVSNVPTAIDCCNLCGARAGCVGFSYQIQTRFCWLKSALNGIGDGYPGIDTGLVTLR